MELTGAPRPVAGAGFEPSLPAACAGTPPCVSDQARDGLFSGVAHAARWQESADRLIAARYKV